ncbi:hypothetical protein B0H66DRAFT_110385 [Apodospora peruviana]|uniref:PLD phosphodiesterase domain-containing protein n=1 Tax=Apodospora peruviana TaxID=516989 RepID=A0AAE0IHH5_9PEZI|nr:hypothetical protein B0H66DRAFT_110385 [Apodospora peruviana]
MNQPSRFAHEFLRRLQEQTKLQQSTSRRDALAIDALTTVQVPDHHDLVSQSTPQSFQLGTGASIFTHSLIPAITSASSEVIFVTCFWAPSKTLSALHDALVKLAAYRRNLTDHDNAHVPPPLRVRICLSSRSLFQKLLHPQSRNGYIYPSSSWQKALGLPDPELLEAAGIQLQVKSRFFLPFSVMHPKFVIIDRQHAFVPSCNVSWESWLEGCVEVTGDAVQALLSFYSQTWERNLDYKKPLTGQATGDQVFDSRQAGLSVIPSSTYHYAAVPPAEALLPTLVLPSSFHRNPQFRPFPWQKAPKPPATPLNTALLELFDQAQQSIYVQTPNLTCEPVIVALLEALQRGVDVNIVTSRNMMLLEQLITAGTTTSWCIRSLVRRFNKLAEKLAENAHDVETGRPQLGQLRVSYFRPRRIATAAGHEEQSRMASDPEEEEPVHSHLKLTVVDEQYTVLGSGNMDRASWYTSQELGILFDDGRFAKAVKSTVDKVLDARLDLIFDSAAR